MRDVVLFVLAAEHASAAAVNVHSFEELLLSIHALELDIGVTAGGRIVLLVLRACFQDVLRLPLNLLDLLLYLHDFLLEVDISAIVLRLPILGVAHFSALCLLALQGLECFIKLLLSDKQLAHLFHEAQVAEVCEAELHVPDVVLIQINLARVGVGQLYRLLRVDVLGPGVEHGWQVLQFLRVRICSHHNSEVSRDDSARVDFPLSGQLDPVEGQERAPEIKSDQKVEQDDNDSNHVLCDLDLILKEEDARGGALCHDDVLPVGGSCLGQRAAIIKARLIKLELAGLLALALGLETVDKLNLLGLGEVVDVALAGVVVPLDAVHVRRVCHLRAVNLVKC